MIHTYQINGLEVQTGDVICTQDGRPDILPGEFWRLVGRLVPGDVDHIVMYLGPNGRCIEAGPLGVVTFTLHEQTWDSVREMPERGHLVDTLYGTSYPLKNLRLSKRKENDMRAELADYLLTQVGKPYNIDFLNSETEKAFYCSQLAYKAYQKIGINLNTGLSVAKIVGTHTIIFPQEIWNVAKYKKPAIAKP